MANEIVVDVSSNEIRVALLENKDLAEIYIERPNTERLVGNIYRAKVSSVLPGMQAAFIDIGYEKNAFLYVGDAVNQSGMSEDFGFGFQFGLGYHVNENITVGAYYQSEVETEYENVFDGLPGNPTDGVYETLALSQPAEYGVGIAFKNGDLTVTADYRKILWSEADGYDNFGWDDQDIFALGVAYTMGDLTLRAGYNYGESPLKDIGSVAPTTAAIQQNIMFNMLGFPAFSDSHITLGFGYQISEKMGLDVAYVYAPDVTITSPMGLEASNEQNSLTFAISYKFD